MRDVMADQKPNADDRKEKQPAKSDQPRIAAGGTRFVFFFERREFGIAGAGCVGSLVNVPVARRGQESKNASPKDEHGIKPEFYLVTHRRTALIKQIIGQAKGNSVI